MSYDKDEEARATINEAVRAAMDEWKRGGTKNIDRMRELIDTLVEEAITEWQEANVDATTDEEQEPTDARNADRIDGFDRDDLGESPDY